MTDHLMVKAAASVHVQDSKSGRLSINVPSGPSLSITWLHVCVLKMTGAHPEIEIFQCNSGTEQRSQMITIFCEEKFFRQITDVPGFDFEASGGVVVACHDIDGHAVPRFKVYTQRGCV
jgi:hypothetical protein